MCVCRMLSVGLTVSVLSVYGGFAVDFVGFCASGLLWTTVRILMIEMMKTRIHDVGLLRVACFLLCMLAVAIAIGDDRRWCSNCSTVLCIQTVEIQRFGLLPGKAISAEMTVATGRLINGLAQLQFSVEIAETESKKGFIHGIKHISFGIEVQIPSVRNVCIILDQ